MAETREVEFIKQDILKLAEKRDWKNTKNLLLNLPPPDITEILSVLNEEQMVVVFRLLPRQLAADVFFELESDHREALLDRMSRENVKYLLADLSPDERTELFEELPGEITQKLINLLSPEDRRETLTLLGYPENSVGRLMTPDYVAVKPHWSIGRALEHIRRFGRDAETINMVYIIDDTWHLLDDIPLRKIILSEPEQKVESVLDRRFVSISAYEDQEEAVKLIQRYDLVALPVVDSHQVLLGIVTVDDVLDVLEDEVTEDFQKGGGIVPFEIRYTTASPGTLYLKRVIWLSLLALTGFLTGNVIASFEHTLATVISLTFFIPLLIDTGGNTGTQSATLIIRSLATGDLTLKKWLFIIKKELVVGLLLGATLGGILCLWSFLWMGTFQLSLVVGLSALFIVLWANIIGSILPIVLARFRLDPAVISSPLLTTILDVSGLLIYFMIALWLLT